MKKGLIALLVVTLGAVGYATYYYFQKQSQILMDYEYKIIGFKIKKFSINEIALDIQIRFISKSKIEANVKELYLDIYLEDTKVGYVTENKGFVIPANGFSDIPLAFSFNPQLVLKNIVSLVIAGSQKKDLAFSIDGYANIQSGFISTTLPIKYSSTLKAYL